jgi:MoaA/NifB/PqqE/SkfB family radical SAM enzyme
MGRLALLKAVTPGRMVEAVRLRGMGGMAQHAIRRVGALAGSALVGPEVVQINPMTYVCNHACPMCWLQHVEPGHLRAMQGREKREGLRLGDYVRLFDGMLPGLREVMLIGGGEPLAHPDAVGIMREVKRHGWCGSLVTNGSLLREDVARALVDMRWDAIRVSIHAGDAETYRAVQGVDRFDVVRANLRAFDGLRRRGTVRCELSVLHVLQPANVGAIDALFALAEEVGADRIVFDVVLAYDDRMRLDPADLPRIADSLRSAARASRVPSTLPTAFARLGYVAHEQTTDAPSVAPLPPGSQPSPAAVAPFVPGKRCAVGFDQTFITSFGDVQPCCFSDEHMGNVREQPFRDIWHGARYRDFRRRLIAGSFAKYCSENRCALASVLQY